MRLGYPRFASLFSGCGGFDVGFEQEGFHPVAAYDHNRHAIDNYRANLGGIGICTDLSAGIPNEDTIRGIDALIAGPPCQGFSTAGQRRLDDERNHLLPLTAHLAIRIQPKVLIVENVSGALAGAHAKYWVELDQTLRSVGYKTHTLRCQTADLGMAQTRRRLLLFAWKTKNEPKFPVTCNKPASLSDIFQQIEGTKNHIPIPLKHGTMAWRIANRIKPGQKLSNVRGGSNAVATWDIPEVFGEVSAKEKTVLEILRRLRRQERRRDYGDADPVSLTRLEEALGTPFLRLLGSLEHKGYVRRKENDYDLVGTFNGKFRRLSWDKPSCTVDTRFGSPRYFLHPTQNRGFTVREAARIQGFPDGYVFSGEEKNQFKIIGNAVPPPLGRLAAIYTSHLLGRL